VSEHVSLRSTSELLEQQFARLSRLVMGSDTESETKGTKPLSPLADYFSRSSPREGSRIVSVIGRRGSGKSTLLSGATELLASTSDVIVLPITRPETFRSTDSILSVFATHLSALVDLGLHENTNNIEIDHYHQLASRTTKAAALGGAAARHFINAKNESLSQFAADSVGILKQNESLHLNFANLIDAVRKLNGVSSSSPIIVPIDDIDLMSTRISEILTDLRFLASLDRVRPLVCANQPDLTAHLAADLASEYGEGLDRSHVKQLAERQVEKMLRPDLKFRPATLNHSQRKDFVPLHETESLLQRVEKLCTTLDSVGSGIVITPRSV
jgi:energy-coupling factor transporter ATP-binding protein EcfA2